MYMQTGEKGNKKFTQAEKLSIIKGAQMKGVKETLSKYGLFPATYYYWKWKYEIYGEPGLSHSARADDNRIQKLEQENTQFKLLLAEKEMQIKYPDLPIKKNRSKMERVVAVREMMSRGIKRDESLRTIGISNNQYYYKSKGVTQGRPKSETTKQRYPKKKSLKYRMKK